MPRRRAIGDRDGGPGEVQGDRGAVRVARAAPSTTGTSLYSQGCRSITCPSGKSWVTPGAKMPKWVRLSSAVSGPECPATQITLPDLELAVLGELAEEAHGAVLQVAERAVGRAGGGESVPFLERPLGEVDRGDAGRHAGVGELGDLLREEHPLGIGVALVLAPSLDIAAEVLGQPGEVGRIGQVGGEARGEAAGRTSSGPRR